ncbi:MAG: hypothetical protein GXO91_03275 [FCB group bacterium]|nr:hypothetical protein [FCB group bacterium]
MTKTNCWEFKKCGREPNGAKIEDLGVCPAAVETKVDGVNHGKNGGRACWPLTGTFCGGVVQGSFAMKLTNCMACDFYQLVGAEEGPEHQSAKDILAMLA